MPFSALIPQLVSQFQTDILPQSLRFLIDVSPILLVCLLGSIFVPLWVRYVRARYFLDTKRVVLEIKLPKDTFKSPLAMELFLMSFHNTADGNWVKAYWDGETRPFVSLELISIEGQVKMLIWAEEKRRGFIESSLYAQFPGIEVTERDDYTRTATFDPKLQKMWGGEFKFTQKSDAYPIKTYIDYGLDKDPKEEFKVDPLAPLLEYLGSVGPNQQVWIQIIMRAHKDDAKKPGQFFKTTDATKDAANELINKLMIRDPKTKISGTFDEKTEMTKMPKLTKGEEQVIEAIERKISKQMFDCGIRAVYLAEKDFFNPANIGGIIGSFKQFSSEHLNGFKPGSAWYPTIEFPWQDIMDIRKNKFLKKMLQAYKRRSYFYHPFKGKIMVLNVEELATIFHFPGAVAGAPTFDRVPSRKSQAPANIPV
jgi:hypothetical protein